MSCALQLPMARPPTPRRWVAAADWARTAVRELNVSSSPARHTSPCSFVADVDSTVNMVPDE